MDKTVAYDEPLDPHWESINALGPSVFQMLHPDAAAWTESDLLDLKGIRADLDEKIDKMLETEKEPGWRRREKMVENIVPFLARISRAREMAANTDRAIEDGHLEQFPDLDGVTIAFRTFAERAQELGYASRTKNGGTPRHEDELLQIYSLAWAALRRFETDGFPLMDYAETKLN